MDVSTRRLLVLLAVSAAAHGAPAASSLVRQHFEQGVPLVVAVMPSFDVDAIEAAHQRRELLRYLGIEGVEDVARARKELVETARRDRERGELVLGTFLLRGAALDAFEKNQPLSPFVAEKAYFDRLAKLRVELGHVEGRDIVTVMSNVYGDLDYHGTGGSIADVLVAGGGACEGLTHLLAASMFDGGLQTNAYVRHWGGGIGHLAPIYVSQGIPIDLLSGQTPKGGSEFPAVELVEVYARHHGLAPAFAPAKNAASDEQLALATLSSGYSPSEEVYGGLIPLYANRALASVSTQAAAADEGEGSGEGAAGREDGRFLDEWDLGCAVGPADGVPTHVDAFVTDSALDLEIDSLMDDSWLSFILRDLARKAAKPPKDEARLVAHFACQYRGYLVASRQLAYRGKMRLVAEAKKRSDTALAEALALSGKLEWNTAQWETLLSLRLLSSLTTIPELAEKVMTRLEDPKQDRQVLERHVELLVDLLADPKLQPRALALVDTLPVMARFRVASQFASGFHTRYRPQIPPDSDLARAARAIEKIFVITRTQSDIDIIAELLKAGMPEKWAADFKSEQVTVRKSRADALGGD